jgi:hypothetical protein
MLALNGGVGKLAFALLKVQNALLDRVLDGHFVDLDIDGLVETVDTIDGLFLDEL